MEDQSSKQNQNDNQNPVQQLFEAAKDLSPEERAELIELLSTIKPPNVFVGVGTTSLRAQTVFQINMNSKEEFAQILDVIAANMQESSTSTNKN